jgi:hypothetical protein
VRAAFSVPYCVLSASHASKPQVLAHIHHFRELKDPAAGIRVIFSDPLFLLECLLCGLHCPPGLDYQYGSEFMGNFMVYRIETVFSSLNLLRLYLLGRWFVDHMLADLPKRDTIAGFSRVNIGTLFMIKRLMNSWYGFYYLAVVYVLVICIFGYWYRSAECTACQFVPMSETLSGAGANITTVLHEGCFQGTHSSPLAHITQHILHT